SVLHELADAADRESDDRLSHRHRLEHAQAERLVARSAERGVGFGDRGPRVGEEAAELDAIGDAPRARHANELAALRPIAGDDETRARHAGERLNRDVDLL